MSNQIQQNQNNNYKNIIKQVILPFSNYTPAATIVLQFTNLEDNDSNPTILLNIFEFVGASSGTTSSKTITGIPTEFIPTQDLYFPYGVIENTSLSLKIINIKTNGNIEVFGTFTAGAQDGISGGTIQYKLNPV